MSRRKEGTTWNRKATDRGQWKTLMEGWILQCVDKAEAKREGRDQEDDQAEDGKTTQQRRKEPPGTGKQQTEDNGRH